MFSSIYLYCGCLFYALDYNSILLNFAAQIISALAIGSSFNWLLHPFNKPYQLFFFFSTFLLSIPTRCSELILHIPAQF